MLDRALALNPSFARGWRSSGILRLWAGQLDIAIEHTEASLRLSPRVRIGTSLLTIAIAHFLAGRFDEAEPKLLHYVCGNRGRSTASGDPVGAQ